jgi:hypothetical protein
MRMNMPNSYAEARKLGKFEKSIYKFFLSFLVLADHDVRITIGSTDYDFPKREIKISGKFWRADGCYRTGKCCSKVSMELFLSTSEFSKLQEIYSAPGQLKPWQSLQVSTFVDGNYLNSPLVWTSPGGMKCPYLTSDGSNDGWQGMALAGCTIHELNPIHCALPHVYFDIKKSRGGKEYINVTKRQFGRNWAFGCPVIFIQYNEFARRRDLLLLNRVRDLLIEFTGSANRVSDIIRRIEERPLLAENELIPVREVGG